MSTSIFRAASFVFACCLVALLMAQDTMAQLDGSATEALKSWNDCATKQALIAFVQRVCDPKSSDFVPEPERLAVFDNDGTLWPENPVPFQLAYAFDVVSKRAANDAEFAKHPMVQAVLKKDIPTLLAGDRHEGLLQVIAMTHAGMSVEEFHLADAARR